MCDKSQEYTNDKMNLHIPNTHSVPNKFSVMLIFDMIWYVFKLESNKLHSVMSSYD